ncbi:hypothetical protein [Pseudomonas proteolytica]|uniref:hypothetical protein n=1 Tax=Pseudomonas proteolytica TaxID=219574 RepID=UPI001475F41F|nr:hypothetical protein [Pseudomonas proteolytica]
MPQISDLDVPGPMPPMAVLVTGSLLPAPSAEGVYTHNGRTYLDLETGETVLVVRDPHTGEWRERAPHHLAATGASVQRVAGSSLWARRNAVAQAPVSLPIAVPARGRLDPVWDLQRYDVSQASNVPLFPMAGMNDFVVEGTRYYVNAQFNLKAFRIKQSHIQQRGPNGNLRPSGSFAEDGIIRLSGREPLTYLHVGGVTSRIELDNVRQKWRLLGNGVEAIYLDTGGHLSSWVPQLQLRDIGDIISQARRVLGYTGVSSDMSQGVMSTMDKNTYVYMQQYARQLIGSETTAIHQAPVRDRDRMIDEHIWRHGYPYDRLRQAISAQADGRALPAGIAQFDPLQGTATVSVREGGSFNVQSVSSNAQLHYPRRRRSDEHQRLFEQWSALDIHATRQRGEANERMYRQMLVEDGYRIIPGGTYGMGLHGFDLVFRGPADAVYLLEIKHIPPSNTHRLSSVSMAKGLGYWQMEDRWVSAVLAHSEAANSPAGDAVRHALGNQQLFKLVGATAPNGTQYVFKIDMSPVR